MLAILRHSSSSLQHTRQQHLIQDESLVSAPKAPVFMYNEMPMVVVYAFRKSLPRSVPAIRWEEWSSRSFMHQLRVSDPLNDGSG